VAPRSSPGWIEVRDWQKAGKAQQPTLDETDHKQVLFFLFFSSSSCSPYVHSCSLG
jgi:hypothetical protein